jgi:hypothetical protein
MSYELRWTTTKDDDPAAEAKSGVVAGAERLTREACERARGDWERKFESVHEAGRVLGIVTVSSCEPVSD